MVEEKAEGSRKRNYYDQAVASTAITIAQAERTAWENATCFVTDRVAFQMRNLIRTLRKNYWGVFDNPVDPTTGREKTWIPLTETVCESVVKNIDLDTKDINFRAKKPESAPLASLVRHAMRCELEQMGFGEQIDQLLRDLAMDGTAIWKTFPLKGKDGKKRPRIARVDLLNFYIDPVADSIYEATSVMERALLTKSEFMSMTGWHDKEDVYASTSYSPNDDYIRQKAGEVPMVEVWERWGDAPKSLLTGEASDLQTMVPMHIVYSNLGQSARVHLIEENKRTDVDGVALKPYEEARYTKVGGRWYGRGPAEKLTMLQLWLNIVANIRINRSFVSQMGLFKVKRGSGVTPQMLSRLAVNGAINVNSMDDIEQFVMQEAGPSSYRDEDTIKSWAERLTSTYEVATGESMPSSTPATNAAIQSNAAQSQFTLVKESVGMFLQRWIKRQVMPIMQKNIRRDDVIRLSSDSEEVRAFDERVANEAVYRDLKAKVDAGIWVDPMSVEAERHKILEQLQAAGNDRFMRLAEDVDLFDYDVSVDVTNEGFDKAVLARDLTTIFQAVAANPALGIDPAGILRQITTLMGIDMPAPKYQAQPIGLPGQMPGMPGALPPGMVPPSANQSAQAAPTTSRQQLVTQSGTRSQ